MSEKRGKVHRARFISFCHANKKLILRMVMVVPLQNCFTLGSLFLTHWGIIYTYL